MASSRLPRVLWILPIVLVAPLVAGPVSARVSANVVSNGGMVPPTPLTPIAGERVSEAVGTFEVSLSGAKDVRIVAARFSFDPTRWTSLPKGQAWTIVPYGAKPVALAPLGLAGRTETNIWWAVVWTDAASGAMRASEARPFTLVPRFANRMAPEGTMQPSASGRIPPRPEFEAPSSAPATALSAASSAPRREIELAAGYSLVPGGALPQLPAHLAKVRTSGSEGETAGPDAYIVQFADDDPAAARERIASAGGTIVSPIGDGYLIRMASDAKTRLGQVDGAPWIADFEPAYKLSRDLDLAASERVDVTALLFPDGDVEATAVALRVLGATVLKTHRGDVNRLARFELEASRLADAAALKDVQWIEPSPKNVPMNDQAQWVVQSGTTESRSVWDHGLRGQGQIVMTGDSGIRTNHEMFDDSTQAILAFGDYPTHRKIVAYKPSTIDPNVTFGDDVLQSYHGTHTAGTVAGNPDAVSNSPWGGIAKDARLYFMDMAGNANGGFYTPDDLNDFFQPSYDGNAAGAARISSNSWGSTSSVARYTISSMHLDQFVWNHPDYLIAFANGNYGVFNSVTSPGTAKNSLSVGASGNGDLQNRLATFSSRGPTYDGRRKPLVIAPGDLVTSSVGGTRYTYGTYSGTSMATPAVAGAMALVRQYLTEGSYPTGVPVAANAFEPSAALMKAMAVAAARNDIVSYTAPDNSIGFGRLTIDDVLHFPGDALRTLLVDTEDGLEHQEFIEYQVRVTDPTQPLKIALCWSDAPGTPLAQVVLVNDLDLVVTHDGSTYRGNYLLNNVSVPGLVRDSLNVEEFVRLAAPGAGLWTVRVEGRRVLRGPQPFALCVTGGVGGPNGAVAFDRFEYTLADTVAIEVVDTDAVGSVTVHVSSNTETFPETITLAGSHGVFRGSVVIAPDAVHLNDDELAVSSGDIVTVSYVDGSSGVPVVATARVDGTVPTISNVHARPLGATTAIVTWTTDVAATTRVHYGPTAALGATVESGAFSTVHSALITGLQAETTYRYDVESVMIDGGSSRDSLGGARRSFTTKPRGSLALVMCDPSPGVLATWNNALAALGWDADVIPIEANDPPLVGNSSSGLRSYDAVLWQVGPDTYPPFSDAQRAAVDSLVEGGARLLVTGHDIGFGLGDAGSPTYSIERELWLERTLKSRYYFDNLYADTLTGVAGSPISGPYTGSIPYYPWDYADSGDNFGPAPGTDGVWSPEWTDNRIHQMYIGMRWESNAPEGVAGVGVWGGKQTRIVGMFFEWPVLVGPSHEILTDRTGVLERAVAWLLGHEPPEVRINSPEPGSVFTTGFIPISFSIEAGAGRTITSRALDYSLDGGESWTPIQSAAWADSACLWDLSGALGGGPTPNSLNTKLRMRVADDGSPSLHSTFVMSNAFRIARPAGDLRGPAVIAGTVTCSPVPIRGDQPATLYATFSDAETGGSIVSAAEYSHGPAPAPAGSGMAMTAPFFGSMTVSVSAALATAGVSTGTETYWVRGRDASGKWGGATAITVPSVSRGTVAVDDGAFVDFLGAPSPSPFQGKTSIRFGLAKSGDVRLELYNVAGRHVRTLVEGTLEAGPHAIQWDGLDHGGRTVPAGVYFVRLVTPTKAHHARVVALN